MTSVLHRTTKRSLAKPSGSLIVATLEGHSPMGGSQDVNEMVKRTIEEIDREIEHLKQELQNQ